MFKPNSITSTDRGTLNVHIKEARDLPATNANGFTDAMVKCFLLPDRSASSKKKTGVVKNNLNPVWEERFEYKREVGLRELLEERVLEVTVWDHDKHGNDFIGGLRVGGAPGRAAHHREWMDSIGAEVTHWEAMLSRPGEWVDEWHVLRPSLVPRDVDLSVPPPSFIMPALSAKLDEPLAVPADKTLIETLSQQSDPPQPVISKPADDDTTSHSPIIPLPPIPEPDIQPEVEPSSAELTGDIPSLKVQEGEEEQEEPESKYQVNSL
jgi:hypothetical protein